ncbi:AfsR/SARP family transcriptional regulator [Streptomyces antimicrobicus]|uniref:AAA family ATPase n=1 Tax=Streptomyces antimicrobicus TaxID=2883108 RepID=A0ABS8BAP7_9ACTN|nr:BTAD domain-containing putative transcriptional regulator [Streptomyces antimicrobicus]MCB5181584.1 AAA family ATPase [Streptomyces antimicrobicus]
MRYLILGVTEARDRDGGVVAVGGARLRALLTALALRGGRPATVAELVADVWGGGEPPRDAPAALQALVSRLRRTLGGKDTVRAEVAGYRLDATEDDIDLYVFRRLARRGAQELAAHPEAAARTLRQALALWRGPALADLPDADTEPAARSAHALREAAVRDRIDADLRRGTDPASLLPELEQLLAVHPYDEPLRARHLRALRAAGRQADALLAYETFRRSLADQLGTDPGPELKALHAELLDPEREPDHSAAPAPALGYEPASGPGPGPGGGDGGGGGGGHGGAVAGSASGLGSGSGGGPGSGNIRPRLTSFVGREPELEALRAELGRFRLVTLIGPGGSGKTRLAEHSAGAHPEPAWLVELAPLDHPAAVPGAVLSALGLREATLVTRDKGAGGTADDPTAQLVEHCGRRRLLIVLDNCEHLVEAAAQLAETLLTHCPDLRILATSREPLGVPGEVLRPVEPLPPEPAVRLFADRGAAARPGFSAADDPDAVREICARLDGLPLAIELAAARLRLLSPRQIADRLDDRFRLLTSGSRTVLPRQQTLRAVVDWSWDLLDEGERTLLRRLSVFAGGWDLAAAEAVCGDARLDAADLLGSLVDKSLVVAVPGGGGTGGGTGGREGRGAAGDQGCDGAGCADDGMRFRMLETIHEYAVERAAEDPADRAATAARHTAHFLALAEEAEPLLRSGAQLPWIRRIETELDNLRAALRTAMATDPASARRFVLALGWFWWLRDYRSEGADWTTEVLALPGTGAEAAAGTGAESASGTGAEAAAGAGAEAAAGTGVAQAQGEPSEPLPDSPAYWDRLRLELLHLFLVAESRRPAEFRSPERMAMARRVQAAFRRPVPEAARFPGMLWPLTAMLSGDLVDFHRALDETVENCRRHGGEWELGVTLMLRTHVAIDLTGGLATVDADLAELHEIARRVGDRWTRAQVSSAAGEVALSRGRYDWARTEYEECLRLAREVGAHMEAPFAIARIAEAAYCTGDCDTAERLLTEAQTEADRYGAQDAQAFGKLLGAFIALDRGNLAAARAAVDAAAAVVDTSQHRTGRAAVPPQFIAGLDTLEVMLLGHEEGPWAGLAKARTGLAAAVEARCAEPVLARFTEAVALLLADADRPAESVRALAAATAWRAGHPRSVPDQRALRDLPSRTLAALGPDRQRAEEAAGSALDPRGVLTLLATTTPA